MNRELTAFLAIAEEGNLTAAAERIGLAQPSLTKMLRRIEARVGSALFDRTARGMRLTPAGQRFLARAKRMEAEYRFALEEVAAIRHRHLDVLRIGVGTLFQILYLPKALETLVGEFPSTRVEVLAETNPVVLPMLERGTLDLVVGSLDTEVDRHGIYPIRLSSTEMAVVHRPGHPVANLALTADALSSYRWVVYRHDEASVRSLEAFFRSHQLPVPDIAVISSSFATSLRVVSGTDCLMLAPAPLSDAIAENGLALRVPRTPIRKLDTAIWLRQSSREYPIINRLVALLKEAVGDVAMS